MLQNTSSARFEKLAKDASFLGELQRLSDERAQYLAKVTRFPSDGKIAYFCMEFGLGPAIPLYAGGLGILAGDYLKTASDLALPVIGVGILYQEGYFRQSIDASGQQHETYSYVDPATLPIEPVLSTDGAWLRVSVDLSGRKLWLRVWRARVGRVELVLLDGNDLMNSPVDRGITAKLYGGSQEIRLEQEIVLGIGGLRALEAMGTIPKLVHLNEGHAAFVVVERARSFALRERMSFREALWATRAGNVFTTHTPVAAGFDAFPPELMKKYFPSSGEYLATVGLSSDELLALGRLDPTDSAARFTMPYLAFRGSGTVNAVSKAHGKVSRDLFAGLVPRWPEAEVPIGHVTNGIHVPSWDSAGADELWTRACGKERWMGSIETLCDAINGVSDEQLWALRATERQNLIAYARDRLRVQLAGRGHEDPSRAAQVLDPNVLTLGFARRFAEYKRPNLLLEDTDRLARILCDEKRPVQIVVAGKAHPADAIGKRMVAEWISFVNRPEMRERAVFIEDYDMGVAEKMVAGVDVWINTPRRPWEACGTSGMKVLANGGLNLSEVDGWWAEAYSSGSGWALGGPEPRSDADDAQTVYRLLEDEVVPGFYDRDAAGVPWGWVARMRASLSRLAPAFSSNRMLREYVEQLYSPAREAFEKRRANGAALARELCRWSDELRARFREIHVGSPDVEVVTGGTRFRVAVYLGELRPETVAVELYADARGQHPQTRVPMNRDGELAGSAGGHLYEAMVAVDRPARDFTARVVPRHPDALIPLELPLIVWQR